MKKILKRIHLSFIPLGVSLGVIAGCSCLSFIRFDFPITKTVVALIFFFCLVNAFIFKCFGRITFSIIAGIFLALVRTEPIINSRNFLSENYGRLMEITLSVIGDTTKKDAC